MKEILLGVCCLTTTIGAAQDPHLDSWMFNTTGLAVYDIGAGPVTMNDSADVLRICYDANHVYVVAEGLASYTMGPFPGNPNVPSAQDYVFKIPRQPVPATNHTAEPVVGPFGVAVNGVALYGKGDSRSYDPMSNSNSPMGAGIWNADAWVSEGSTMDANGNGHPQQQGGYHYHANPIALYSDPSTGHSPIIGWAMDGYPIYGPFGYSSPMDTNSAVVRLDNGYELRNITTRTTLPDGSTSAPPGPNVSATFPLGTYWEDYEYTGNGDLDEFNGRDCRTPEYPDGTYAYFLSTDSLGQPAFPYMIGLEYYGEVNAQDLQGAGNANIPGGVTCTNGLTGTEALSFEDIDLYPNPASEAVQLTLPYGTYTVRVLDGHGKEIQNDRLIGTTMQLEVAGWSRGLYFLQILDEQSKGNVSLRFVVQ